MKKTILFSLIALMILCSAAFADYTADDDKTYLKLAQDTQAGDIVEFGKFNGSALSWLVLDVDEKNNRALLITENCVAKRAFAYSNYEWSHSYVRAYLNGTDGDNFFTSSNFTDDEKAKILNVSINKNNLSKKSDQIISSSGSDYVFLLGVKDANEYFSDDSQRIAKYNNSAVKWWLRYSTKSYARAGYVSTKGKVMSDGSLVSYTTVGVRPAIWVTLPINGTDDSTEKDTTLVTYSGEDILAMDEDTIKKTFENKANIAITGTLNSSQLSTVLENLGKVTIIENLDLHELNVNEVNLDAVTIWYINLKGNTNIKKFETKDSAVVSLDLSNSAVQEIEVNNCEILESVTLENCKEAVKVNFSKTALAKLVVKGCGELTTLSCESSDLKNLDIEDCTKLEKLNVKNNSLPKLKVSKTYFPYLTEFACENQRITSKVSQSFNLKNFLQNFVISSAAVADVSAENSELDSIQNLKAYDKSGNELATVLDPETGIITITDGEPYTLTYNYDTGFKKDNGENVLMDVNISIGNGEKWGAGDGEDILDDENSPSGSSSGCNSGFGFEFAALGLLLNLTRKKFTKK